MSFIVPQGDINMRITAILVFLFMLGCTYSPQLPNVTNAQGTSATGKISQGTIPAQGVGHVSREAVSGFCLLPAHTHEVCQAVRPAQPRCRSC